MIGLTYLGDPLGLYKQPFESQLEVLGLFRADADRAQEAQSKSWGPAPPTVREETAGAWDAFNAFRVA